MLKARAIDVRLMEAAARLAASGQGTTAENPNVGAIVTTADEVPKILGRGVTAAGGRPHAEPQAIAQAGDAAKGAHIYVTLEPCHHFGKTPPCVNTIISSGIKRVYIGLRDPDPRTDGQSIKKLRDAGVEVIHDVAREACQKLHRGFVSRVVRQRPFVTLKQGISADGAIGFEGQGQIAVTGPRANQFTHMMRGHADGILVSARTAALDLPKLNVRLKGFENRQPKRFILGTVDEATAEHLQGVDAGALSILDDPKWRETGGLKAMLRHLGALGINTLFVEAGSGLARAFFEADLVDEYIALVSPKPIGSTGAPLKAIRGHQDWPSALSHYGHRLVEKAKLGDDIKHVFNRA